MANYYQAKQIASRAAFPETDGTGTIYSCTGEFIVPATAFTVGDIIEMCGVPAYHVLEALTALTDQVDSNGSPTMTVDVGYITGAPYDLPGLVAGTRTFTADFLTASTTPVRAGGTQASSSVNLARQIGSTASRSIGFRIAAVAATQVAGARMRLRASYSSDIGDLT